MEGGLDLEKQTSIPVEAELFFLTLFIELIDRGRECYAVTVPARMRYSP